MISTQAIEFMWSGGDTRRYHGLRPLMEDTVGHHSYNVACIIMFLRPDAPAKLLRAALKHDMAEHIVGDMPADTKRALPDFTEYDGQNVSRRTFREVFADYEREVADNAFVDLEQDLDLADAWVLAFADAMDGYRFCIREWELGNRVPRLMRTLKNYRAYLAEALFGETPSHEIWIFAQLMGYAQPQDKELFFHLNGKWSYQ